MGFERSGNKMTHNATRPRRLSVVRPIHLRRIREDTGYPLPLRPDAASIDELSVAAYTTSCV